jgi:hypothetical protein
MTARLRRLTVTLTVGAGLLLSFAPSASAQEPATADRTIISSPAPARDSSALRSAIVATVAGSVFDSVTTVRGLSGGRAREANPILGQHPARIVLMKSVLLIPQILAEKHLVDTGHPRVAKWIGIAAGGFAASLAVHNLTIGR